MRRLLGPLAMVITSLVVTGCASFSEKQASITGRLVCRTPVALPAEATAEVNMMDVSAQTNPPAVLAQLSMRASGGWPIRFVLKYDRKRVIPGHQYAVSATVLCNGRPWLITDTVNHFMEWNRIVGAEVILRPAQ
jgi:putative lipoprotein